MLVWIIRIALEFEYRKHNIVHGVKYAGYDTIKGFELTIGNSKANCNKLLKINRIKDVFMGSFS